MAWVVSITSKNVGNGFTDFAVSFVEGAKGISFTETIRVVAEEVSNLQSRVRNRIKQLDTLSSTTAAINVGVFDPGSDPVMGQEEVDFNVWQRKVKRLRNATELVALGVLTGTESALTALKADVQATFRAVYISRM